jgi:hypothetical protein
MELVYFIENCNKKLDNSETKLREDYKYLYSILPNVIKDKQLNLNIPVCTFIIKSGVRRFQDCGHPLSPNEKYCDKHTEYVFKKNNPELVEQQRKEKERKEEEQKKKEKQISFVVRKKLKATDIILLKNKNNHILWPNTSYVISSFKEKIVIGKEDEEGKIIELKEEDKKYCKEHNIPILES